MASLSEEEISRYTSYFQQVAEANNTATLSVKEFEQVLTMCGHVLPSNVTATLFLNTDTDGDWAISLDEFLAFLGQVAPAGSPESVAAALRHKFNSQDLNKDGYISSDELLSVMDDLNMGLSEEWLQNFIKDWDTDGDGRINFEEFVTMYIKTELLQPDPDADEEEQQEIDQAASDLADILVSADGIRRLCHDQNMVNDGMVSVEDLRFVLSKVKVKLSAEQVETCFSHLDVAGEGKVPLEEFVGMFEDVQVAGEENEGFEDPDICRTMENEPAQMDEAEEPKEEMTAAEEFVPQETESVRVEEYAEQKEGTAEEGNERNGISEARYVQEEEMMVRKHKSDDIAKLSAAFEGKGAATKPRSGCNDDGASQECKSVGVRALIARFGNKAT